MTGEAIYRLTDSVVYVLELTPIRKNCFALSLDLTLAAPSLRCRRSTGSDLNTAEVDLNDLTPLDLIQYVCLVCLGSSLQRVWTTRLT